MVTTGKTLLPNTDGVPAEKRLTRTEALRHYTAECGWFKALGDVGGAVMPTLALTLGPPAAFAAFTPGVGQDYTASTTASVVSSAGDAVLSVGDPSAADTGRLVNGAFALAQPLQVEASSLGGTAAAMAPVEAATELLTYGGPVSNDPVALVVKQTIGANEPLRTGRTRRR